MAHIEDVTDRPQSRQRKAGPPSWVKYYLFVYNALSALGWGYILVCTLVHLFALDTHHLPHLSSPPTLLERISSKLATIPYLSSAKQLLSPSPYAWVEAYLPPSLVPVFRRASTTYERVGRQTAIVQSFAALEVVHVLLGWVRSNAVVTGVQVWSRYNLVWFVAPYFKTAQTSPFYASMVLSWSITEVIRYAHFATTLIGHESRLLLWLRYTTFYILYPTGAGSEALVMFATIPKWDEDWTLTDIRHAVLFVAWWPGLFIMMSHMAKRRSKVLGKGRTLGEKPKSKLQ
ncbi:PTPLA-domain-containing protein [Panus rudis PR-1116 ss-1]|nr:PTPLA-domain-containing protein [Panus rudis PR-1116 ss-1]